ncbi:hypothetical protein [Limosilactobacillus fermentum]|uniref:hypothetical protein n=1 Tax=Limosilactobacillus fermentum TaxID=1613 RepID=UPI002F26A288
MKKIGLFCVTVLAGLSLAGCNNLASQSHKATSSSSSIKVVKHHKGHKKSNKTSHKDKQSSSSSSSQSTSSSSSQSTSNGNATNQQGNNSGQQATAQSNNGGQQQAQGKSQGEINRERGYDPNGNPLLPGQDHAAGSNPDGSPDAWVQGQIDWAKQNGYLNPDGTETPKGQAADEEVERDSQPGMP